MTPEKIEIRQNVNFYYIKEERFTTNSLNIEFLRELEADRCADYQLIAAILRRGGNEKYPDMASLSRAKEENYDCAVGDGCVRDGDITGLGFSSVWIDRSFTPDNHDTESEALSILSQMMLCPRKDENGYFPIETVEREKKNLCDRIRALINNREGYASAKCREMMYENDPYGAPTLGTVDEVMTSTSEGLFRLYRNVIESAPVNIFYAGHAEKEDVMRSVKALLCPILDFQREEYPKVKCEKPSFKTEEKHKSEKMPGAQSILCLGLKTDINIQSEDFLAHRLCWSILSGSSINKFYRRVREAYSLCYFCYGVTDALKGSIIVSTGINAGDRPLSEEKIREQIEDMKRGNISEEEFDAGKKAVRSALRETRDSLFSIENYYLHRIRAQLPTDISPEMMMEKLETLTVSDVMRAAKAMVYDSVFFLEGEGGDGDGDEKEYEQEEGECDE